MPMEDAVAENDAAETEAELTGVAPAPAGRRPRAPAATVGGRRLSPATMMMGHGYDPMLS